LFPCSFFLDEKRTKKITAVFLPPKNGGRNKAGMGPDDPFLNIEKPNNHPFDWLRGVLQRIGQSPIRIEELLPNNWKT
jgi:hypothetical protein